MQVLGYIDIIGGILGIVLFSYVLSAKSPGSVLGDTVRWGTLVTQCIIYIILSVVNIIMGGVGVYSASKCAVFIIVTSIVADPLPSVT